MLKEIVQFTDLLETNGIIDEGRRKLRTLDNSFLIIPLDEEKKQMDKSYFVIYSKEQKKDDNGINKEFWKLAETSKEVLEVNLILDDVPIKTIGELDDDLKELIFEFNNLTMKLKGDSKGNKSIGGNSGTNSYHLLMFSIKKEILKNKDKLSTKLKNTYNNEGHIKNALPENITDDELEKWKKLLEVQDGFADSVFGLTNKFFTIEYKDKDKKPLVHPFNQDDITSSEQIDKAIKELEELGKLKEKYEKYLYLGQIPNYDEERRWEE